MSGYRDGTCDGPAFRHRTVYRTARGLTLSGGRAGVAAGGSDAGSGHGNLPPLRVSATYPVRRGVSLPEPDLAADDAAGVFDAARYSEPND